MTRRHAHRPRRTYTLAGEPVTIPQLALTAALTVVVCVALYVLLVATIAVLG